MYTFLSESTHTARKEHRCIWCPEKILVGEKYNVQSGVYQGDFQANKFHPECYSASQKYFKESGEEDFDPHSFNRGEAWDYDGKTIPGIGLNLWQ